MFPNPSENDFCCNYKTFIRVARQVVRSCAEQTWQEAAAKVSDFLICWSCPDWHSWHSWQLMSGRIVCSGLGESVPHFLRKRERPRAGHVRIFKSSSFRLDALDALGKESRKTDISPDTFLFPFFVQKVDFRKNDGEWFARRRFESINQTENKIYLLRIGSKAESFSHPARLCK